MGKQKRIKKTFCSQCMKQGRSVETDLVENTKAGHRMKCPACGHTYISYSKRAYVLSGIVRKEWNLRWAREIKKEE